VSTKLTTSRLRSAERHRWTGEQAGAAGWDTYAEFYDWENARTLGRRDLPFWRDVLIREGGRTLELGCGTGRLLAPLARAGIAMTGIDRSGPMLSRARRRLARLEPRRRPGVVRGDIRALPFARGTFDAVLAPYGMLQSLLRPSDLSAALESIALVLKRGGRLGVDLVPDLARWDEYGRQVRMRGRSAGGASVTLVESVRQDRRRGLTIFDEEFVRRQAGRRAVRRRFTLTFRTWSMAATRRRLERAGFEIEAVLGDYQGGAWDRRADVWVVLARKRL
jgi:SAM-dependent methyltransferase